MNVEANQDEEILAYFKEAVLFLKNYKWVYNFPVTHFLMPSVLNNIPSFWKTILNLMTVEDLNSMCVGKTEEHWAATLQKFCEDCQKLRFLSSLTDGKDGEGNFVSTSPDSKYKTSGVKPKKMMEVAHLTAHIHQECSNLRVTHILDMGAGLGYLDNALHVEHGYRVLGLENQKAMVHKAQKKFEEICSSENSVKFKHFHVEAGMLNGAVEEVQQWLEECHLLSPKCVHEEKQERYLESNKRAVTALVGLHTCGDLAAATLHLFAQFPLFSVLVVAPCCFHKMTHSEDCDKKLKNFPQSSSLESVIGDAQNFDTPFLRLASQRSSLVLCQQSIEEHEQHSKHVLARAVLQLYALNNNLDVQKTKRKAITSSQLSATGVDLVTHMMSRYQLTPKCHDESCKTENDKYLKDVIKMFEEHTFLCPLIEGVSAMQAALQGVAERLVLSDMQASLIELGGGRLRCRLVPLWDETRSPRARAIFASRIQPKPTQD